MKKIFCFFSVVCFMGFSFIGCDDWNKPKEIIYGKIHISQKDSISFKPVGYLADVLSLDVYLDGEKVATLDSGNDVYVRKYEYETDGSDYSYTLNVVPVIVEKHPTGNVDLEYYFLDMIGGVSIIVDSDHYCNLNVSPDDYDKVIEKIRENLTKSYIVKNGEATK